MQRTTGKCAVFPAFLPGKVAPWRGRLEQQKGWQAVRKARLVSRSHQRNKGISIPFALLYGLPVRTTTAVLPIDYQGLVPQVSLPGFRSDENGWLFQLADARCHL